MFYYSFFSWWKKPLPSLNDAQTYTNHKNTSAVAFYMMLIHALVLESVGFHFLLHSWNATFAIIVLILNVYTLLCFLAEIQAIRLCPFMITNEHLYLQVGMMQQLTVPLEEIKRIHDYQGSEKLSKNEKKIFSMQYFPILLKRNQPLKSEFQTPQEVKLMYGFKKKVTKAHLRPDEPQKFYETLCQRLNDLNN